MLAALASLAGTRAQAAGPQAAAARLRQAARRVPPQTPPDRLAGLRGSLAVAELRAGNFSEARQQFGAVLEIAARLPIATRSGNVALAEYFSGVTWLREVLARECVDRRNDSACILVRGDGAATGEQAALREALAHLQRAQAAAGDGSRIGIASRWLAGLTVAMGDLEGAEAWRWPTSAMPVGSGLTGFANVASAVGLDVFDYAGGMVVDDLDGDGLLDVFSSTTDIAGQVRLFRNRGDGSFEDRTVAAGLTGITGGLNAVQADYDNDGDLDLLVLRGAWRGETGRWPNSLLRNDGDMRFRDVTFDVGLGGVHYPTQVGVWADYDNDGDLDLYVANEATGDLRYPAQLFRNDSGRFVDVAAQAGVTNDRWGKSAAWGDFDDDGWVDLYVSNLHGANRLYRNRRNGTFEDLAPRLGVAGPSSSFAAWFWDANEDGQLDLLVQSYQMPAAGGVGDIWHAVADRLGGEHDAELAKLYLGDDTGGFREVAEAWGIAHSTLPMAANYGDLDNDGWLDFYLGTGYPGFEGLVPNVMYRNDGGQRFADATADGGFGHLAKGHGIAFADIDNDGDQDVLQQLGGFLPGDEYHNALFENPGAPGNWLALELRGAGSNRFAVGARVRVWLRDSRGARSLRRVVGTGGSFGGNPHRLHIGLGGARRAESLEIRWPGGETERFGPLDAGAHYRITEASGEALILRRPALQLAGAPR